MHKQISIIGAGSWGTALAIHLAGNFNQISLWVYEKELCISPIPSLAIHFTNINSIFGLSPNIDWEKIWKENEIK